MTDTERNLSKRVRVFSPRVTELLKSVPWAHTAVIEAPSGYGKTTAGEYLWSEILPAGANSASVRKIWHTCVEEPGSLLWRHFCEVITKIDSFAGGRLASLGLPDADAFGDTLFALADMRCGEETWLLLDDFHNLERKIVERCAGAVGVRVFGEFFRRRTENLHVVILARQFGDRNLRARPDVAWLDFSDLAFTPDETKRFFAENGVRITPKQAEAVRKLTGGCVQGLGLELDRYRQTRKFTPLSDENAYREIMKATIWNGLTEPQKNFLLRVSPFECYTLRQAAFLLDLSCDSPAIENVPRFVLDVSEDRAFAHRLPTEPFYYPHSRVLGFLRFELALDLNFRKEALNRAGEWCIENGEPERAVGFFVMSGDFDRALSVDILGRELTPPEGMTYEELTVSVIENASREAKLKFPVHLLKHAFNLLDTGRKDVFFSVIEQMRRLIADTDMPDGESKRLAGELTLLSSFGEYNDISKMASLMRRAHELTGGRPSLIRMNDTWTFGSASVLFIYHSEPGRLDAELADMKEGCGYYFALTGGHGSGGDTLMEAESLFNRGDWKKAAYVARDALERAENRKQASVCIGACFLLAREALTRGDAKAFSAFRERMAGYSAQTGLRSDLLEADMADCWLMSPFMSACEPPTPKCFQAMPFHRIALGKFLMPKGAKNHADGWLTIADESMSIARALRSELAAVYCGIFTAAARLFFGDEKRAFSAFDEAFSSAMSDRLYMPFAEHYFAIQPLLEKFRGRDGNAGKIAPLARKLEAGRRAVSRKLFMDAPFGLSKGEYRVALLASRGMPNDDIARQLGVTRDGVRYHLKSVYKKTGAASRRELEKLFRGETLSKNR